MNFQSALSNLSRSLDSYFYYMTAENLVVSPALESESTTEVPDALLFQYSISDIFEDVKLLSASLAKFAIGEKTGDQFDTITVTEEDRLMFDRFCKSAALYAYTKIQGLAKTIDRAFLFNEGITVIDFNPLTTPPVLFPAGSFVRHEGTVYRASEESNVAPDENVNIWEEMPDYIDTIGKITLLISNKATYDPNVIRVWNDNLKDIIVNYILEKIFKFRNLGQDLLAIVMSERITKEQELIGTIHSRKVPVKRYVSWP